MGANMKVQLTGVRVTLGHGEDVDNETTPPHKQSKPLVSTALLSHVKTTDRIYIWKQHLAALLANVPSLCAGLALGWSAPALPTLTEAAGAGPQRLSLEEASWLGAVLPLASLAGALVAGPLAERIGRKGALLATAAPTLLGWALMACAGQSLWQLLAGRLLTGMTTGAVSAPAALYCEEIAEARIRGALGTYQFMGNSVGVCVMYILGAYLPYFWFTAAPLLPALAFVVTFCWMPESPAFLAARGRRTDAHVSLRWLRGPAADPEEELRVLLGVSEAPSASSTSAPKRHTFRTLAWTQPWRSNTLRGLVIASAMMVFQQMSGMILFVFYTVQVIEEVDSSFSSYTTSIILGTINMLAVFISILAVDRVGRRVLLLISSIAMGLCLIASSIYSFIRDGGWDVGCWKWFPVSAIAIHGLCFSLGMGPVSWILLAELLPMKSKGWASPVVVCVNRIAMFLVAKKAPLMLVNAGQVTTFSFFGVFCFLCAFFIAFCVPETKGKTKQEILQAVGGDKP